MIRCEFCQKIKWPGHKCDLSPARRFRHPTVSELSDQSIYQPDLANPYPVFDSTNIGPETNAPQTPQFEGFGGGDSGGAGASGSYDSSSSACDTSPSDSGSSSCDSGSSSGGGDW